MSTPPSRPPYPMTRDASFPGLRRPDRESWTEIIDGLGDPSMDEAEVLENEGAFSIAQTYLDCRATLHLHLRVRPGGFESDPHEFCAVIASQRGDILHVEDRPYVAHGDWVPWPLTREGVIDDDPRRRSLRQDTGDVEKPMLVYVVEPRELGQLRIRRAFSFLKGLDRLDRCPISRAYTAKFGFGARLVPLPAFVDREFRSLVRDVAFEEDELPDEIIKRGPQVVSELPDDQSDAGVGELPFKAEDILAGLAIEMSNNSAALLVKEGTPFAVESGQVLLRAFESPVDGF